MTIRFQAVSYPIMGGTDRKISGFVLPAPKLQLAQNVMSDQTGSLRRRYGRDAFNNDVMDGTTATGWVAASTHKGHMIGFTPTNVYVYEEEMGKWIDHGRCTSWRQSTQSVSAPSGSVNPNGPAMDVAVSGNFRMWGYDVHEHVGANIKSRVRFTLVDDFGTRIASDFELAAHIGAVRVDSGIRVIAHGVRFYVIFSDVNNPTNLKCFIVNTTSAATITSSLAASAVDVITAGTLASVVFDACENPVYGPFLAYRSTTANTIGFGHVNTSGVLIDTSTTGTTSAAATISVDVAPGSALHGIVYTRDTVPTDVYACLRTWNGAVWAATATSAALDVGLTNTVARQACIFDNATDLRVFYDGDVNTLFNCIRQSVFTVGGASVLRQVVLVRSAIAAKPFKIDDVVHYWVTDEDSSRVGRILYLMNAISGDLCGVANRGGALGIGTQTDFNFLSHVAVDGSKYSICTEYLTRTGRLRSDANAAFREVTIDTEDTESYVCVEDGQCTYVPSAIMQQYDGVGCTEVNFYFVVSQPRVTYTASNAAGSLTNSGVYSYRIIPEWTNAQGEREQGTDTGPKTLTLGVADDTVTIVVPNHPWTRKQDGLLIVPRRDRISYGIYRTTANPTSDSPHFRVGVVQGDPALDSVTFTDLVSDTIAETHEELSQDSELANLAPDPGFILAAGNGRVFVGGLPDDPSLAIYSKERGHGQPLVFNGALQVQFPLDGGDISSLAVMDEQLLGFTPALVYRVAGDGFSNAGTGAGFAPAVIMTADGGALGHRGVSVTPVGTVYQSQRGIMRMAPGLASEYIGAPLELSPEASNLGHLVNVAVQPALQLIHFMYEGITHVYDYYHKQWYIWTQTNDGPTAIWHDTAVSVSNNLIQFNSTARHNDAGDDYTATIVLGWERGPSTMQGDLAFRRIAITGMSLDAHYLEIRVAHDYDTTTTQTVDTTIAAAGVLRQQFRVGRQKANSLQITIRDAFVGLYNVDVVQATAGFRLNEITFEVGVRGGLSGRRVL